RTTFYLLTSNFLVACALVATTPQLSIDVLSYVAQGHQAATGGSPYAEASRSLDGMPFGRELSRFGWIPVHGLSPYGPAWTAFEMLTNRLGASVRAQMLLIKVVVVLFSFGCAWLVWSILGGVAPRAQLAGTILYLWNPVVVVEFAGEGHNDAVL